MTTATMNKSDLMAPAVAQTMETRSMFIGLVGAVASIAAAFIKPDNFYSAYLTVYVAALGLSLGCMAIVMLYHLVGGAWGTVIRRIMEAGMMTLPLMAVLFLPILFNLRWLYDWARPEQLAADHKLADIAHTYLYFGGIFWRYVIYFALWIGMAFLLSRWSSQQDYPESEGRSTLRFRALSAPGLVIYSLSISFAIIDWVMSLQARWISTIYGLIFIAGQALAAFSFAVVIEHILSKRKPMSDYLTPTQVHDHGKFMLAFVMVWAYFNFSQWLIYWAGNLPEEITWFLRRINGGWGWVALFLVLFHFAVPFAILLSRQFKRQVGNLAWLAAAILVVRLVDIWWHVEPAASLHHDKVWFNPSLLAALAGIGGLWMAYFFRNLRSRPLLAVYAPQTLRLLEPSHE